MTEVVLNVGVWIWLLVGCVIAFYMYNKSDEISINKGKAAISIACIPILIYAISMEGRLSLFNFILLVLLACRLYDALSNIWQYYSPLPENTGKD